MNDEQQKSVELIRLKARLFDMQEESQGLTEVLSAIAKRVGFTGQSLSALIEAVPVIEVTESE